MIPLGVFLLGVAAVYLGAIEAAFSALMRLSLRLVAERSDRSDQLGAYLDDPLLLFVPVRFLLGLVTAAATALLAAGVGIAGLHTVALIAGGVVLFVLVCELLLPILLVGHDPERALELLLPTFRPIATTVGPLSRWIARSL